MYIFVQYFSRKICNHKLVAVPQSLTIAGGGVDMVSFFLLKKINKKSFTQNIDDLLKKRWNLSIIFAKDAV
jgi:hypothetical protein